jgi:hypothetical protein
LMFLMLQVQGQKNGNISEANHYFMCPAIEPWEENPCVARPSCRGFLAGFGNLTVQGRCCRNFE